MLQVTIGLHLSSDLHRPASHQVPSRLLSELTHPSNNRLEGLILSVLTGIHESLSSNRIRPTKILPRLNISSILMTHLSDPLFLEIVERNQA